VGEPVSRPLIGAAEDLVEEAAEAYANGLLRTWEEADMRNADIDTVRALLRAGALGVRELYSLTACASGILTYHYSRTVAGGLEYALMRDPHVRLWISNQNPALLPTDLRSAAHRVRGELGDLEWGGL
jgi:hypothetical protein